MRFRHYFQGGEGNFVSPPYVIFNDTENPMAQKLANSILENFSNAKNTYEQTENEFFILLKNLAMAERKKEMLFLNARIDRLVAGEYSKNDPLILELEKDIDSVEIGRISAMFNILYNSEKEIKAFKENYEKIKNDKLSIKKILKSTAFSRNFKTYFHNYINERLTGWGKMTEWVSESVNDKDIMQIIDSFLNGFIKDDGVSKLAEQTRNELAERILRELQNSATSKKLLPAEWFTAKVDKNGNKFFPVLNLEELKKIMGDGAQDFRVTTNASTIRKFLKQAIPNVIKGLASEYQVTYDGTNIIKDKIFSSLAVHTGNIQAKVDVAIIESEGDITEEIAEDIRNKMYNLKGTGSQVINETLSDIQNFFKGAKKTSIVAVSNKDYISDMNMYLGSGAMIDMVNRLRNMLGEIGLNISLIDFIFNMYNMVPEAFLENERESILENLGYLAAVWAFDDVTDMFSMNLEDNSSSSNILHLFNLNGMYYTLSDLLMTTVDKSFGKKLIEGNIDFKNNVSIHTLYENLRDKNRLKGQDFDDNIKYFWDTIATTTGKQNNLSVTMRQDGLRQMASILGSLL